MCSVCKAIGVIETPKIYWMKRNENPIGYDALMENLQVSHGICTPCLKEFYGEKLANKVLKKLNPSS